MAEGGGRHLRHTASSRSGTRCSARSTIGSKLSARHTTPCVRRRAFVQCALRSGVACVTVCPLETVGGLSMSPFAPRSCLPLVFGALSLAMLGCGPDEPIDEAEAPVDAAEQAISGGYTDND